MGSWFLNAGFLGMGAAALVSAPVIIHLINRYRFRRVEFAAMEFLLSSQQQNRRRVLIEQLLLLLLRILLVMGLIALIARMVLDPSALSLLRGAEVYHVVLLDDSASLQDSWSETDGWAEAKGVVNDLVAKSLAEGGRQHLTLVRLSRTTQPEYVDQRIDAAFQGELKARLETLPCSFQRLELADGLDAVAQLLADQPVGIKHLHVVSDYRQFDWKDSTPLVELLDRIAKDDVSINLVRSVPAWHPNLTVTGLSGELQVASAGVPVKLTVTVANRGTQLINQENLSVFVDTERLPLAVTLEGLEAGKEVEQSFEVTFDSAGKHRLEVRLPGDALAADNSRFLAVEVAAANRVLVIEGNDTDEEGLFPTLALAANPQASGYQTVVATPDYLYRQNIDAFQSILLLNVPELAPDAVESLEAFVRDGGGLVWYVGDAVNAVSYNNVLYAEGRGLFPVPLANAPRDLPRDEVATPGPDIVLEEHPILAGLQGQENPEIEATRVNRYFPVSDDWDLDDRRRDDGVTTIAHLRNRAPFLLEHRFGAGRVITCLTTCGTAWTNFPQYRSFVPFQFELQKYISRADRVLPLRESGMPIHLELDPAQFGPSIRIEPPKQAGMVTSELQVQPEPLEPGGGDDPQGPDGKNGKNGGTGTKKSAEVLRRVVDFDRTDTPGIYRVRMVDAADVNVEQWFAYNTGSDEGRLELAKPDDLRTALGPELLKNVRIQEAGTAELYEGRESDRDVREWLLVLLVLVLLAEQLLAYRLSYHPGGKAAKAGKAGKAATVAGAAS